MEQILELAYEIAETAHKKQTDKSGAPYFGHVERVSNMGQTLDEKVVGMLHDLIEDTDWTFELLAAKGFAPQIIQALRLVTKLSEDEPYDDFIERIATNPLAIAVKLNDLRDNMDITRLEEFTDKDVKRTRKYLKAYHYLIKKQQEIMLVSLQNKKEQDFKELRSAAESGDKESQYHLGLHLLEEKNRQNEAFFWFEKAANQEYAPAICELGGCYLEGVGVIEDLKKAVELFTKSAEMNCTKAQHALANCYEDGTGVEIDGSKAIEFYCQASENGDTSAMYNLARVCMEGKIIKQDIENAIHFYKIAAQEGHVKAMYNLANIFRQGIYVDINVPFALKLLETAADLGHVNSMGKLGDIYGLGEGVELDYQKALYWYEKAAAYGDELSIRNIKSIKEHLTHQN